MFEQLVSWENLLLAYYQAAKGKRGYPNVASFEYRLEENLLSLQSDLQSQTYIPGAYHSFFIHEPKRRLISAAPFRDRVVHHALCNLIEPIFERSFIFHSYANRVGKGTHRALNYAQKSARRYSYVLQCDVRQFFPSIDHNILQRLLEKKITDRKVLWLCNQILESGKNVLSEEYDMVWFHGDDLFAIQRPRGLPIGNLTSQFWANVYLNPFDHFVSRTLRPGAYLRYVDDFLLFGNSKSELWDWLNEIESFLARFRLTIHPQVQPRPAASGFSFLGFQVFPNRRRLKRRKFISFRRKFRALLKSYSDRKVTLEQVTASVKGWINHARYGNTAGLVKSILRESIPPARK